MCMILHLECVSCIHFYSLFIFVNTAQYNDADLHTFNDYVPVIRFQQHG